jgi:hypothetical protein
MMVRSVRQLLVVAACVTALVACGSATAALPVVPAASIPTSDPSAFGAAASSVVPFTIPGVLACVPSDLEVSLQADNPSYIGAGPTNATAWEFDIRDIASKPCFVGPTPNVSFYGPSGLIAMPKDMDWPGNIVYLAPALDPAPPYFSSATGSLSIEGCYLTHVDHVRIDLGGTLGSVDVVPGPAGGYGKACPTGGDFYSSELYGGGNNENTGGWAPFTQTTIEAPPSAYPGEHLQFQVTLENVPAPRLGNGTPQSALMNLKPCPSFYEEIEGVVGTFHTSLLDCAKAKPIPPGGSETFDMFIDIPMNARPAPATLIWSVIGSPEYYQEGTGYLPIT